MKYILLLMMLFEVSLMGKAQSMSSKVVDKDSHEAIIGAVVYVGSSQKVAAITDINGRFSIDAANAGKSLKITYIGYKNYLGKLNQALYEMEPEIKSVGEVVVTAQESKSLASASVIEKHAMEHLQPSSFTDILELLPGGRSKDPDLSSPNTIRIREAGSPSGYTTTSLGTSFVVDGAPISTNANMQYVAGSWDAATTSRENMNAGVDMRSISTDDIEKVEVVRGIPSVEYGDLTSGLVKIERKRGGNDWNARLKADMGSKLFYLAKGLEWTPQQMTLNLSVDYLDAKADPRNRLENYRRLTFSARFGKTWLTDFYRWKISSNLDYTGSFDNDKVDPDLNNQAEDSYKSQYNKYAFNSHVSLSPKKRIWFKSLDLTLSASYEYDLIKRTKLVQLTRQTVAATATTQGVHDGVILPYKYVACHDVEGKPLNLYAKVNGKFQVPSLVVSNTLLLGTDWNYDKNKGRGQIYDVTRPLYAGSMSCRPRNLSSIPSNQQWGIYAEEQLTLPLAGHSLELVAGIRGTQMLNLPDNYEMHGKFFWDPRINLGLTFPKFNIGKLPSFIRIAGGIGEHTKMPTLEQLYPDPVYLDLTQLNYYHTNPAYRRINLMTYVIDATNQNLKPARNFKWEVSTDINIGGNRLSVTLFRENMTSGFRLQTAYAPYIYRWYDASGIDADALSAPPSLEGLPFEKRKELRGYSYYTNGSQTLKRGVEYTFATRRIEKLFTRLTINGAWFRTVYRNSVVETYRPSAVIGSKQIQYVGYYEHDGGNMNEMLNTNFTLDSDVPKLKLGFSISAQCLWYTLKQSKEVSNYPTSYMDNDGVMHEWKAGDENDAYLRYLIRDYNDSYYLKYRVPFAMNVNFKVTKKLFDEKLNVALFCNKLLDYTPEYENNGVTIRRHVTPYFGLEMNVKI